MFNFIKRIIKALPFGMKAADEILTTSNAEVGKGIIIQQQVEKKSVLQDMLNGEVTQEVEELRYETFKSEELANDYQYIGNGQAVKKKNTDEESKKKMRKKFVQYNSDEVYSLQESLIMLENPDNAFKDDWKKRKIFKATYKNPCVRFKLENYADKVRVDLTNDTYKTYLYFIDDSLNRQVRPLVNFIKKTKAEVEKIKECGNENKLRVYKEKNELYSDLDTFYFTTISASNDVPNGIDYNFRSPRLEEIIEEDGYVILLYVWKDFSGNVLLSERFRSKTAEEKFENKAPREGYAQPLDMNIKEKEKVQVRSRDEENLEAWLKEEDNSSIEEDKVE